MTAPTLTKVREQFEAWATFGGMDIARFDEDGYYSGVGGQYSGDYICEEIQLAWCAWKACFAIAWKARGGRDAETCERQEDIIGFVCAAAIRKEDAE